MKSSFYLLSFLLVFVSTLLGFLLFLNHKENKELEALSLTRNHLHSTYLQLQNQRKSTRGDEIEMRRKGWKKPASRLRAAQCLEALKRMGGIVSYTFDPEEIQKISEKHISRVTPVHILCSTSSDHHIYVFIEKIEEQFPGLLLPQALSLSWDETTPSFIKASLRYEWIYEGAETP